jgi:hypothetical protein
MAGKCGSFPPSVLFFFGTLTTAWVPEKVLYFGLYSKRVNHNSDKTGCSTGAQKYYSARLGFKKQHPKPSSSEFLWVIRKPPPYVPNNHVSLPV